MSNSLRMLGREHGKDVDVNNAFKDRLWWATQEAESLLRDTWAATCPSTPTTKAAERSMRHTAAVCASLSVAKTFDHPTWTKEVCISHLFEVDGSRTFVDLDGSAFW